jgi:hypothetical protein
MKSSIVSLRQLPGEAIAFEAGTMVYERLRRVRRIVQHRERVLSSGAANSRILATACRNCWPVSLVRSENEK